MQLTSLEEAAAALAPFGYDPAVQAHFAARAGQQSDNAVKGQLTPLPDAAMAKLPDLGSAERERLRAVGLRLVREGRVGVVILAGGMATRFGGVVKAVVPAHAGRSFFELKHADIAGLAALAGGRIPTFVMSSFATHDGINAHVAERGLGANANAPIEVFPQMAAVRLTPEGALFRDAGGMLSPHATGHGDLPFALRQSGILGRFRAAGGTILYMSNVDNLGATLDPAMIALHAELAGAVTVEVVRKHPGDAGGAPAQLDGVAQIIEGFRFPPSFDQASIAVFNTNTLCFDAACLDSEFVLPYYRVEKKVEGAPVVQFERLVGELTAFLPTQFVEVPRVGADCRFIAVKEPADLESQRELITEVTSSQRSFRG